MYVCMYASMCVCVCVCVHTLYANMPTSALLQPNVAIKSSYSEGSRLKPQHVDQTTEDLTCLPQSLRQSWENYIQIRYGQFISNYLLMVLIFDVV
jgi:hypothetical protein